MSAAQHIAATDLPVVGAAEVEPLPDGVLLHRLPRSARVQCPDPMLALAESMPAGVRIAFHTDAMSFELDVDLAILALPDRPPVPAVFELVVDGRLAQTQSTTVGTHLSLDAAGQVVVTPGPTATVRFELPGDESASLEVWLPHAARVAIRAARITAGATLTPAARRGPRWVHYGSSISHCLEATGPTSTWPAAVALRAGWDLRDLGLGGQCMLDQFVARTIRDAAADAISLKVGINIVNGDTLRERTFVPALHGFLDTVREGHPETPLVLISPVICPAVETAPGPTVAQDGRFEAVPRTDALAVGALSLSRIRELMSSVVATRDDPHLQLVDGLTLFGARDVDDLHDGLHPNAAGYLRMADRFYEQVCTPAHLFHGLLAAGPARAAGR